MERRRRKEKKKKEQDEHEGEGDVFGLKFQGLVLLKGNHVAKLCRGEEDEEENKEEEEDGEKKKKEEDKHRREGHILLWIKLKNCLKSVTLI